MSTLPGPVREVTGLFLSLADEALPGLVEGLYLHGSLGFGEWYDGRSDVDYVAVLAERPDAATAETLRAVHEAVATTFQHPSFDGFHATWADLAASPSQCPDLPCTQGGIWHLRERIDVHPVTWHELARHGVEVRGPALAGVDLWTDPAELRRYTRENLDSYWRGEAESLSRFPVEAGGPETVVWSVLGVARLHHLLATDRLTSKAGAGRYAAEAFDQRWRPIVAEALALRVTGETSGYYDGVEGRRGADNAAFTAMVVEDGLARR